MLTALPTASIIRAALWGFGQLFPFSEFFDNPGQSLIQSAKYLLSWCRKGRYQCPPRKEPQDTRFATSPTRHRIAGCKRSVRAVRFTETQVSMVSIALRDQLIHNILVWRAVQRESLTRQGSKAGKIRVRTGRESDRLRWEPEEKSSTKVWILHTLVVTSGYLSYCCLSIISNQSDHSPLTSTRHFPPHNCHSLDIFSFSDHSL